MSGGSPTSSTSPIESKLSSVAQQYDPRTNPFCSRPHRRTPKKLQTALLMHQAADDVSIRSDHVHLVGSIRKKTWSVQIDRDIESSLFSSFLA